MRVRDFDGGGGDVVLHGPVIGVLSPFIGGVYYGAILNGIVEAAALAGSRVIAVQTLDAGAYMTVSLGSASFTQPVAWDSIAGFITLADGVEHAYLRRIRAEGKPVVLAGHEVADFDCPAVVADNRVGIREAVTHIIDHGHRRIAFVGYPTASDIADRYDAYRETLTAHGITPDPALYFPATNNLESGVEHLGDAVLAATPAPTAIIAATDRNAIGLIEALTAAGRRVPRDHAVVGFDDLDIAQFQTPGLASVRQMLDTMGGAAVGLLLRQLAGEDVPCGAYRVPTAFVPRGSCGCVDTGTVLTAAPETPRGRLAGRLEGLLPPTGARRPEDVQIWDAAVSAVVTMIDAAVAGRPTRAHVLTAAMVKLYCIREQAESLAVIGRAVHDYAQGFGADDVGAVRRVAGCVQELVMAVAHAHGQAQFAHSWHLRSTVSAQYELSMNLLHNRDADPRTLAWLARTPASAGCLGLWTSPGSDQEELMVSAGWLREEGTPVPGGLCSIRTFPPVELLEAVGPGEVVFVVPAKVNASDRGMLAVVGTVETKVEDGREMTNQCAALLTVALDLRDHESRLRQAALSDVLTGLPNRAAFVDVLDAAVRRASHAEEYRFGVLFLDLDGFKRINDMLGHATGDRLLIHVANRIRANLRATDTAARFGGDEFLVFVQDVVCPEQLQEIADRLSQAITARYDLDGEQVSVGVSIGITASGTGDARCTADEILHSADAAMYLAKAEGKKLVSS